MTDTQKPHILITNDDGVKSPGILFLAETLSKKAHVYVIAPASEKSGVGHAFTHREGLICHEVPGNFPFAFHSLSGTPADCVKFAVSELYKGISFDLILSGINRGENAGVSSFYSGTVAGAREAALWGLRGIAVSLSFYENGWLNHAVSWVLQMIENKLYLEMAEGTYWNVNFPHSALENYKGMRVSVMNRSMFTDHYKQKEGSWWLDGIKEPTAMQKHSDDWFLSNGFASLTPMTLDQTAFEECARLQLLNF